jgi:hypothetical protein
MFYVDKSYMKFQVMGEELAIVSDETAYGRNTVVEIKNRYHYMGDEPPNVATAVFAWQEVNDRELTSEELHRVMVDNHLVSGAI